MITSKLTQATAHKKPLLVVKLGGSMLNELSDSFIHSVKELLKTNNLIFVHGGGPDINAMLERLKVKSEFINGQRKTTAAVLEVVEMVLAGKTNKFLTAKLGRHHLQTIGLSGSDFITTSYIDESTLGLVGKVEAVNEQLLQVLLDLSFIPVVAPLGRTVDGQTLNINADICAAAVAEKMNAEKLIFVTDVPGILKEGKLMKQATKSMIEELIQDGTIYGGMIPKVTSALSVLSNRLKEAMIVNGHTEIVQNGAIIGTKIVRNEKVVM